MTVYRSFQRQASRSVLCEFKKSRTINNGTYVSELNGYVSFMIGKRYGFVGLDRTTGDITTFHIKNISELIKKAPSLGFER